MYRRRCLTPPHRRSALAQPPRATPIDLAVTATRQPVLTGDAAQHKAATVQRQSELPPPPGLLRSAQGAQRRAPSRPSGARRPLYQGLQYGLNVGKIPGSEEPPLRHHSAPIVERCLRRIASVRLSGEAPARITATGHPADGVDRIHPVGVPRPRHVRGRLNPPVHENAGLSRWPRDTIVETMSFRSSISRTSQRRSHSRSLGMHVGVRYPAVQP